ncbi:hypothetical protein L484_021349 [Morus notabilis]|uniref:Uncharacterized protein n=1 Tax=Morus notabilis TaxID=981085 RepID=W9S6F1_9ROSA|nr:hypothetical protein L484_021349 [Morus notabilis]
MPCRVHLAAPWLALSPRRDTATVPALPRVDAAAVTTSSRFAAPLPPSPHHRDSRRRCRAHA